MFRLIGTVHLTGYRVDSHDDMMADSDEEGMGMSDMSEEDMSDDSEAEEGELSHLFAV